MPRADTQPTMMGEATKRRKGFENETLSKETPSLIPKRLADARGMKNDGGSQEEA